MMEVRGNEFVEIDVKEMFFILLHELCLIAIIGILFALCIGLASIYLLAPSSPSCPDLCKNMVLGAFGGILFTLVFLLLGRRMWNVPGYVAEDIEKTPQDEIEF